MRRFTATVHTLGRVNYPVRGLQLSRFPAESSERENRNKQNQANKQKTDCSPVGHFPRTNFQRQNAQLQHLCHWSLCTPMPLKNLVLFC